MSRLWLDFVEQIHSLHARIVATGSIPWYRGHRLERWPLKATIHRYIEELLEASGKAWTPLEKRSLLRDEYKSIFRQFRSDAWPFLEEIQRDNWGLVFTMRHIGLPTRFLDWTESFACALFFAQQDRNTNEDAAIFVLDPHVFNKESVDIEGILDLETESGTLMFDTNPWHPRWLPPKEDLQSVAVQPFLTDRRMVAQRARFVLCGDGFTPLEDEHPRGVHKFVLSSEMFHDARQFLDLVGIGPFGYFPDLEGLRMKFQQRRAEMLDAGSQHRKKSELV